MRWILGRVVMGAWVVTIGACGFGVVNSDDRNPLQFPSVMVAMLVIIITLALTLVYWGFVVVEMLTGRWREARREKWEQQREDEGPPARKIWVE